jgi:hypothetical protein
MFVEPGLTTERPNMKRSDLIYILSLFGGEAAQQVPKTASLDLQKLLHLPNRSGLSSDITKIAVIGAGISGSSFAYQTQKEYGYLLPLEVVVFEASSRIGGLMNTTMRDNGENDEYHGFVENGANSFCGQDDCIQRSIDEVGLRRQVEEVPRRTSPYSSHTVVGVWEHAQIILRRSRDLKSRTHLEYLWDVWRYGDSVRKMFALCKDKLSRFRNVYPAHGYPDSNLLQAIQRVGLLDESRIPADQYLFKAGISSTYLHEVVGPTARKLFGHDLDNLNALSALIAMDPTETFRIDSHPNGILELPDRLLRLSRARVELEAPVASIATNERGQYLVHPARQDGLFSVTESLHGPFDVVDIASHIRKSGLKFDFDTTADTTILPTFNESHVIHFTTPMDVTLSPKMFNLTRPEVIPDIIYTTASQELGLFSVEHGWASTGLRPGGDVVEDERLVKVVSSHAISDSIIAELLGQPEDMALAKLGVRWVHRQAWPLAFPCQVTGPKLDNIELAPNLFYTGVAEEVIPTMEMNCRVAKNVAGLIGGRLLAQRTQARGFRAGYQTSMEPVNFF